MDRSTSLAALTRLHLRKRGHWRRLNIMCNKERREEVWAARPATLAFVPAPATAAPLTPPPGWSVGSSISPRFLQSPHCSGVVEAVSCRRGHGVVVTTYCIIWWFNIYSHPAPAPARPHQLSPNRRNSSGQGKSVLYIVLLLYIWCMLAREDLTFLSDF